MRLKRKTINLFEDDVYNVKQVISISNEDDLNQFWNFITKSKNSSHNLIQIFITQFYNFAINYILKEDAKFFEVIFEENKEYFYFTLWNREVAKLFENYLKKTTLKYIIDKSRITIRLKKKKYKEKLEKIEFQNKARENNLIKSIEEKTKPKKIKPYTFLTNDDLEELLQLSDNLVELVYQANKIGLNEELFISFRSTFSLFCLTLRYYDEISPIANTITNFSNLLNTNKEKFIDLDSLELELINGFINNIERWLRILFIDGGADLHFMDNSIKADYDTIEQIINPSEYIEENLDDIFAF